MDSLSQDVFLCSQPTLQNIPLHTNVTCGYILDCSQCSGLSAVLSVQSYQITEQLRDKYKQHPLCHNLAKWLSHYFILLSFYFLIWTYYTRKECRKGSHDNVACHSHISVCTWMMSHDKCGKVVHRPCSSCISSVVMRLSQMATYWFVSWWFNN